MIRPTRTMRVAAVFAAATLVLTACGSDSGSDSDKSDSDSKAAAKGDGTLTIGTLLPQTGDLAFLGPPEFAGVQAAVNEINEAGGVDGKKIVKMDSDSGDLTPDIAGASVDKLLAQDADVIVGAASSNVSKSVIDKITGAGVVQFSPANTAAGFDEYPDKGLYFRTAPSAVLQGKVVANLAVQDGNKNVAVLARQDFYGEGLADSATKNLEAGGATVAAKVLYNAEAENFTAEVNEIAAKKPDAIILVSFDETAKIIPQ
jgi:ABC-type branched-subunit amino acid transport system substrate-binding protein